MPQPTAAPQSILSIPGNAPKLLDQFREAARAHGHTEGWAAESADWRRRFILFHGKRHPNDMGITEIGRFMEQVAKTDIEGRKLSSQSPMPARLVKTPEELKDLLAYLLSNNPAPP